jgi:diguanylate cyclase (GGDEF)-like protein/putative nucleotidyltransferase with HDIG domain
MLSRGAKNREAELASQLAAAQRRIAQLESDTKQADPATGLLTLTAFRGRIEPEIDRARRHGRPLAVGVLDIDGFRSLNANHGYAVGDQVLRAVGRILDVHTRSHDVACRTGADEFAVLMPETDAAGALQSFERILLELEAITLGGVTCVSASVGIASYLRGQSSEQLIATAAKAIDRARAAGGGRSAVAGEAGADGQPPGPTDAQQDVVAGLAVALLERDRYTGEHSESVVEMAAAVARALGVPEAEVGRIRSAALLHDIGKVAIPDEILRKDGPLDETQWMLMREHPVIGERILRAIPGMGGVARIVRHEHERWDGGGYPDSLSGEEIPIGSRIILACDAYHAMTSDRPYRAAMAHAEAIRELTAHAGAQFDPEVVEILVGYLYGLRQAGRLETDGESASRLETDAEPAGRIAPAA